MPNRPVELVPGALPARVRYCVADDATVVRLAGRLKAALESADPTIYGDTVIVHPGAWIYIRNDLHLDAQDAIMLHMVDPASIPNAIAQGGGRPGRFFRTKHAMALLAPEVSRLLHDDGGFKVRALQTAEMTKWWKYIGFDIEEPVYVVESAGRQYRFVFGFSHDRVLILDELNGLPDEG